MIFVLISIVFLLSVVLFYLIYQISSIKIEHSKTVSNLESVIHQLLNEQKKQSSNLKLSDELKGKLVKARVSIDENVMDLQKDLISIIAKNK